MSMLVSSRLLQPAAPTPAMAIYENDFAHSHKVNTTPLPKYFNIPFAIQHGYFRCIRYLLQLQYDSNERDSQLRTPLILCSYVENDRWSLSIAQNLLEKGAKVALEDHAKRNAMHHACALQRIHLVQLFLSCLDFNIDAKDSEGNTCLHYAAITGNCGIAELIIRCGEKHGIRLDQYLNREGCSAAVLALKYGHIECANQITHRDWDEFFVVPRPLSIYECPSSIDSNQLTMSQTKNKNSVNIQKSEKKSEINPSSLSFGLLKIIFNDNDNSYSSRLAGLCKQAKQSRRRQHLKHLKHEAPQTLTTTINKLDRTKSTLANGTQYSSTEAVVNEAQSTKEHKKPTEINGIMFNSSQMSPRTQLFAQQNLLDKSNFSDNNSSFIQKTTSKTHFSVDDLNSNKLNSLKINYDENKPKIHKQTTYTQTSHSTFNHSENNNLRAKIKSRNSAMSMSNNQTYIHSSTSQIGSAKVKATHVLSAALRKKSLVNDPFDSILNQPKQNHSFIGSDSSTYSQILYAGRSVSAAAHHTNTKSNDSSCSIREATDQTCRYNKPEELFGVRPEELFAPDEHQPKIIDQNFIIKLNDSKRLKRHQLQRQQYMWQQDVDKIIDLYNVHHCANYRKPAIPPPPAVLATQTVNQNETNGDSTLNNKGRRGSISKHATNGKSSNHSKQPLNSSINIPRRNSISRPSIKLTNA